MHKKVNFTARCTSKKLNFVSCLDHMFYSIKLQKHLAKANEVRIHTVDFSVTTATIISRNRWFKPFSCREPL